MSLLSSCTTASLSSQTYCLISTASIETCLIEIWHNFFFGVCLHRCRFNWSITVSRFKARSPNRLQIQVVFFESGRLFFLRYFFRDWFTLFLTNFISIVAPFSGDLPTTPSVTTLTCCVWRWGQRTSKTQRGYNCVEFDLFMPG